MRAKAPSLIVFAREPIPRRAKTRLIPAIGADAAAALASAFTLDALSKAFRSDRAALVLAGSAPGGARQSPYFRALARRFGAQLVEQGEGSLGRRMARVMEPYIADGAALIGTDIPSLPLGLLNRSLALLRRSPVVLAPSLDGGYYLVGIRGPMPDMFRGVRWGGRRVLARTAACTIAISTRCSRFRLPAAFRRAPSGTSPISARWPASESLPLHTALDAPPAPARAAPARSLSARQGRHRYTSTR